MQVTLFDRVMAAAWWVALIVVGPPSLFGFFVGGWLVLGALAAVWMNLDVHNPFTGSTVALPSARQTAVRERRERERWAGYRQDSRLG